MTTTAMTKPSSSTPARHQPQGEPTLEQTFKANSAKLQQAAGALLDSGRLISLALIAVNKTPALARCSTTSIMQALMDCARYGLEPDGVQAAIVPYKGNAQAQPMYQGLITIAFDEPTLESLEARTVRDGDDFLVHLGSDPKIHHIPALGADVDTVRDGIAYYAVAHLRGHSTFEVMTRAEVELIKRRSPSVSAGARSPWDTDYDEMAKKTVLKRLLKKLPKRSRRLRDVIDHDNRVEGGEIVEGEVTAKTAPPKELPAGGVDEPAPAPKGASPEMKRKAARWLIEHCATIDRCETPEEYDVAVKAAEEKVAALAKVDDRLLAMANAYTMAAAAKVGGFEITSTPEDAAALADLRALREAVEAEAAAAAKNETAK